MRKSKAKPKTFTLADSLLEEIDRLKDDIEQEQMKLWEMENDLALLEVEYNDARNSETD